MSLRLRHLACGLLAATCVATPAAAEVSESRVLIDNAMATIREFCPRLISDTFPGPPRGPAEFGLRPIAGEENAWEGASILGTLTVLYDPGYPVCTVGMESFIAADLGEAVIKQLELESYNHVQIEPQPGTRQAQLFKYSATQRSRADFAILIVPAEQSLTVSFTEKAAN